MQSSLKWAISWQVKHKTQLVLTEIIINVTQKRRVFLCAGAPEIMVELGTTVHSLDSAMLSRLAVCPISLFSSTNHALPAIRCAED